MCTSVAYGLVVIMLTAVAIGAIMSALYIKNKLYLNRIINGIFIVTVIFVTYLYGISYKKIPEINSYIDSYIGVDTNTIGVVKDITYKETYTQLFIENASVTVNINIEAKEEDKEQHTLQKTIKNVKLLANTNDTSIKKGDVVSITGTIKTFDVARNEGNFDSAVYYRSIGIDYKITAKNIEVIKNNRSWLLKKLDIIKEKQLKVYKSIADKDDVGIFISMVLGDKSFLEADIKELYQKNGISHLLAISGLHISLIGMMIYNMLRKLRQSFLISSSVAIFIIICYGIMTGNSISTRRAVIMLVISLVAQVVGRTYDIITAISISAIILIYDNPYVLYNPAFQLSFGAVAGIILVYPALKLIISNIKPINNIKNLCENNILISYLSKKMGVLIDMLLISVAVNIVTIPVIIFNYFEFPPYSVILNLIVVPFMSLLMICAVLAGIIGIFSLNIATFVIGVSHYILKLYDILCRYAQRLPHSLIVTGRPEKKNIVIYYIIVIIFILIINIIKYIHENSNVDNVCKIIKDRVLCYFRYEILFVVLLFAFAILVNKEQSQLEIDMLDVGQGDSIFMQTPDNKTYLFDGGSTDIKEVGKYRIMPFLKSKKVTTLDCVMISHSDLDHISGIIELINMTCDTFSIRKIVLPDIKDKTQDNAYCELEVKAGEYGIEVEYISSGDIIFNGNIVKDISAINNIKDNISQNTKNKQLIIECVHPTNDYDYSCANDYSATYLTTYERFKTLMTGDIQDTAEKYIINNQNLTEVSVLKTAHHGSSTSSSEEFLNIIKPQVAIISCGINNRYHHPSNKVIERFNKFNIKTKITSEEGQIKIYSDGSTFQVKSYLSF